MTQAMCPIINKIETYEKNKEKTLTTSPLKIINEIFSATNYLKLYHLDDEEDFSRIENLKEFKSVASNHQSLVEFLHHIALVESEYFDKEKNFIDKDTVKLMTLHQVKGLEFSVVFIVGVEEGLLPHYQSLDDHFSLEEERRLFYVGITRAKKKLFITYALKRFILGSRRSSDKSRFLED